MNSFNAEQYFGFFFLVLVVLFFLVKLICDLIDIVKSFFEKSELTDIADKKPYQMPYYDTEAIQREEQLIQKIEEIIKKLESLPSEQPIEVYERTTAYTPGSMYLSPGILGTVITFRNIRDKYTRDIQKVCEASILKNLQANGFITYVMQYSSDGDNAADLIFEPGDIGVSADAEILEVIKRIDEEAGHLRGKEIEHLRIVK